MKSSLTVASIKGLIDFLPLLQNKEADFTRIGIWGEMPSRVSAATAGNLYQYLYNSGFVLEEFEWMLWSDEAITFEEEREKLRNADIETIQKILTTHMLAGRINEGHYDSIIENGFLADVIKRLKDIFDNDGL